MACEFPKAMRRGQGPTKKFIPTMSPETICKHVYVEDEGLQLEIDCVACQGANDLSNPRCFAGVLNAMVSGANPDAIILKKYIHKRYRQDVVAQAVVAATELAALNRALSSLDGPSDKRCRTCVASKENTLAAMKRRLLEEPETYLLRNRNVLEEIRAKNTVDYCNRASSCIEGGFSVCTLSRRAV